MEGTGRGGGPSPPGTPPKRRERSAPRDRDPGGGGRPHVQAERAHSPEQGPGGGRAWSGTPGRGGGRPSAEDRAGKDSRSRSRARPVRRTDGRIPETCGAAEHAPGGRARPQGGGRGPNLRSGGARLGERPGPDVRPGHPCPGRGADCARSAGGSGRLRRWGDVRQGAGCSAARHRADIPGGGSPERSGRRHAAAGERDGRNTPDSGRDAPPGGGQRPKGSGPNSAGAGSFPGTDCFPPGERSAGPDRGPEGCLGDPNRPPGPHGARPGASGPGGGPGPELEPPARRGADPPPRGTRRRRDVRQAGWKNTGGPPPGRRGGAPNGSGPWSRGAAGDGKNRPGGARTA